MSANTYALELSRTEIESSYRDLNRHLVGNNTIYAVRAALGLAKIDGAALWKFLKIFAVEEVNHRETNHFVAIDSLYSFWTQDPQDAFIAQAVTILANLTKTRSESVLKFLPAVPNNKY